MREWLGGSRSQNVATQSQPVLRGSLSACSARECPEVQATGGRKLDQRLLSNAFCFAWSAGQSLMKWGCAFVVSSCVFSNCHEVSLTRPCGER